MADEWGIEPRWYDVAGREHEVSDGTLAQLRAILSRAADGGPIVVRGSDPSAPVARGSLILEHGDTIRIHGTFPDDLPLGYHTLQRDDGAEQRVIVAPSQCRLPGGRRAWGWAAQLYATRSRASWGMGDFGDLARLTRWSARRGARFVLVNPLGAVSPTMPQQPSPYYPASRRFLNPIYLRVADVRGADHSGARGAVARARAAGEERNRERLIDRDAVWTLKLAALEAIWRTAPSLDGFTRWAEHQPEALRQFATWCVLAETHDGSWHEWPSELHDPRGAAVRAFASDVRNVDRVRFHLWLQWLASTQLETAAAHTALVQDLPIGVDPEGFDAWEWQDVLALGATVGAPPDEFNNRGQDWGLPPFDPQRLRAANYQPFVDTIRASMAEGGGVRIDHVMGLFRLWWIPEGNAATDGAYVRYPADDLLAILALESHRAGAFVVGEDLGTVEDSARAALAAHDILSYKLLWFEDPEPSEWSRTALAAITTHDLPTVVGLWTGRDLAAQRAAGLDPDEPSFDAIRDRLAARGHLAADAAPDAAVIAAHTLLARSPSMLLTATLDDAVGEPERPNIPGADGHRPNWSLALETPLEDMEVHPLAARVAEILTDSVEDRSEGRHA